MDLYHWSCNSCDFSLMEIDACPFLMLEDGSEVRITPVEGKWSEVERIGTDHGTVRRIDRRAFFCLSCGKAAYYSLDDWSGIALSIEDLNHPQQPHKPNIAAPSCMSCGSGDLYPVRGKPQGCLSFFIMFPKKVHCPKCKRGLLSGGEMIG